MLRRLLSEEGGATSIEYAMVASGIAVAIVSVVNVLGNKVNTQLFARIAAAF